MHLSQVATVKRWGNEWDQDIQNKIKRNKTKPEMPKLLKSNIRNAFQDTGVGKNTQNRTWVAQDQPQAVMDGA